MLTLLRTLLTGLLMVLITVASDAVSNLWRHVLSPFFTQGWVMITVTLKSQKKA